MTMVMFERIHERLTRLTTWRRATVAWVVTVGLLAVYSWYIMPLQEMAGGQVHLDVRFGVGYTLADVLSYFEALGAAGRALYTRTTLFDTVWPLGIAITGALWAPLAFRNPRWVVLAAATPVLFGVLDLVENCGLLLMLSQYPDVSPTLAALNNVITLVKQLMIPGWAIAIPSLPIIAVVRRRREIR